MSENNSDLSANNDATPELSCTLTGPELQQRKSTILSSLSEKILETTESENGFSFRFSGGDEILDELITFIKSERQCCSFFTFNLSVSEFIWLELSGPTGAKEFIKTEMGF
jgi:hypothetical protein